MFDRKSGRKFRLLSTASVPVLALASSYSGAAVAQESDEVEQVPTLEEIVVTATKREESLSDAPLAITALSGEFTSEVNLKDAKDVINWTPGITGNSQDNFIDVVSVRGILTNDFGVGGDPSVGFFKNNLYQGRNGYVVSSFFDMERTEAARGPQNFLFGRGAIGGAISIFTKRPDLGSNGGYVDFDVGEREHFDAEGAVNISASDRFGIRVAGLYSRETDGYVDNIARPDIRDSLRHENFAVRLSSLYEVDDFNLLFTAEFEDRNQDGTVYRAIEGTRTFNRLNELFGLEVRGGPRDIDQDFGFDGIEDDNDVWRLGLHMEWDLGTVTLSSDTGYTRHDWIYIEDFDGTNFQINDYLQDQKGDYFQQDLRVSSNDTGPLSWYAGVSFFREDINAFFSEKADEGLVCAYYFAAYYPDYYPTGAAALEGCQSYYGDPLDGELIEDNQAIGDYTGWAGYVNANYAFSDKFDFEAGVRFARQNKEFSLEAFPVDSVLGPFFELGFTTTEPLVDEQAWDAFTPRFVARYRPTPGWTAYASVTRGWKAGGFGSFNIEAPRGQPPLPFFNPDVSNEDARPGDFDSEKVWSFETGLKGEALDGSLRFDFAAYYYTYSDLQLTVAGEGGGIVVDNVGDVDGFGFEGSVQWVLNEYVDLRASAAQANTDIRGAQGICPDPDPNACEGKSLSYVPDFSGSARVNFHYPISSGEFTATAEVFGQTETGGIPITTDPAAKIKAYGDISLRLGFESNDRWSIVGYVENVTDVVYFDGIFAGGGIFPDVKFNPSRPRTFGIRLSMSFGSG